MYTLLGGISLGVLITIIVHVLDKNEKAPFGTYAVIGTCSMAIAIFLEKILK